MAFPLNNQPPSATGPTIDATSNIPNSGNKLINPSNMDADK